MDKLDIRWKELLQPKPIDGVRVPAANFHNAVVAIRIGEPADFLSRLFNYFGFAKFVDKLHNAILALS
jgi:hypothetical protein